MYKILIADDEQIIRDGMRKLIDWNSLGLQLVGVAENGKEAYDMIKKFNPDIAMVDINMPLINGLELCKIIKEEEIDCEVIIVTGYDEFNYAREALRQDVKDYISKPVTRVELSEILTNVVNELDKKAIKLNGIKELNNQVRDSKNILQNKYLNSLLYGDVNIELLKLDLIKIGINTQCGCYAISILDMDNVLNTFKSFKENQLKITTFAINNIAEEILRKKGNGVLFITEENESCILFFNREYGEKSVLSGFINTLTEIRNACKEYIKVTVSVGVGNLVGNIEDVSKSYGKAKNAIEYRFFIGNDVIVYENEIMDSFSNFSDGLRDIEKSIIKLVKNLKDDLVISELDSFNRYMKLQKLDKNICINEWVKLLVLMMETFVDMNVDIKKVLNGSINVTEKVSSFKNIEDIKLWALELYEKYSEYIKIHSSTNKMYFIQIKEYINDNFNRQEFSFKDLCNYVHLSPSYLSALFKNELRKTFMEYLTEVRMQKATDFLKKTNLKTYQIASEVGYSDPHYFSTVFKKTFNVSPSEYRNHK